MGGDILPEEQLSASLRFAANTILFLIFLIFVIPYSYKIIYKILDQNQFFTLLPLLMEYINKKIIYIIQ